MTSQNGTDPLYHAPTASLKSVEFADVTSKKQRTVHAVILTRQLDALQVNKLKLNRNHSSSYASLGSNKRSLSFTYDKLHCSD